MRPVIDGEMRPMSHSSEYYFIEINQLIICRLRGIKLFTQFYCVKPGFTG